MPLFHVFCLGMGSITKYRGAMNEEISRKERWTLFAVALSVPNNDAINVVEISINRRKTLIKKEHIQVRVNGRLVVLYKPGDILGTSPFHRKKWQAHRTHVGRHVRPHTIAVRTDSAVQSRQKGIKGYYFEIAISGIPSDCSTRKTIKKQEFQVRIPRFHDR